MPHSRRCGKCHISLTRVMLDNRMWPTMRNAKCCAPQFGPSGKVDLDLSNAIGGSRLACVFGARERINGLIKSMRMRHAHARADRPLTGRRAW